MIFSIQISAQHGDCGTSRETLDQLGEDLQKNREEMQNMVFNRDVTYVPIRFHLVAYSSGNQRESERNAINGLCILNENYADQDIHFYLKEFNYINSTAFFENPDSFGGQIALNSNLEHDAINVFIVRKITQDTLSGGFTAGFYLGPPGSNNDYIVLIKGQLTSPTTFTHEIGHFFTLDHPFNGWDFNPHDTDVHGNPVLMTTSPEGVDVELVNGSNCLTAGDFLCDTPADYNFGPAGGCNYTGGVMDANGDLLDPAEDNFMNYFSGCSEYFFSNDQKEVVQNSLNANNRNYLESSYVPNLDEIADNIQLTSPQQLETVSGYNYVTLEWTPMANATHYVVDIIGTPTFSVVVETPYAVIQDRLLPNQNYFWRVKPFSDGYHCANNSPQIFFKTPSNTVDVTEVSEIQDWSVMPNPVSNQNEINVLVDAANAFEGDISLVNIAGATLKNINNYQFTNGQSSVKIDVSDLPAGLYNVVIQTKNGISNQKLVIQ